MTAPHLLVVDDEPSIRDPLAAYLEQHQYKVSTAPNAADARGVIEAEPIDLVLLDVMMPGEDGLSLVRDIRATSSLPVILLTAMAEETDRIIGLELGADDYVVKPFNPRELLARIRAVLRRGTNETTAADEAGAEHWAFAGFRLDGAARVVTNPEGEEIDLTGGEYTLLHCLAERAGRVLSRDQLLEMTQGRPGDMFDRSIDNQVSRLRKKLGDDPKSPSLIKTVRGGGYVFSAVVRKGK